MDVLFILHELKGGGTQNVVKQVAESFSKKDKNVSILILSEINDNQVNLSKRVNILKFKSKKNFFLKKLNFIKEIFFIRKVIKRNDPKAIMGLIVRTNILLIIASIGLKKKIYISERNDPKKQNIGMILRLLRIILYNRASIVTYNSRNAKSELSKYVSKQKLIYLPNPIKKIYNETEKQQYDFDLENNNFIFIGKIDYQKGIDILLKAFSIFSKSISGWKLIIVGDSYNNYYKNLKLLEKELELKDIKWVRYQSNLYNYFKKSNIFILPSRYEGAPNVLFEAIDHKKAIICSDAVKEAFFYLEDEHSCLFFKNNDSFDLAKKMLKISSNSEFQKKLVNNISKNNMNDHKNALNIWYNFFFKSN